MTMKYYLLVIAILLAMGNVSAANETGFSTYNLQFMGFSEPMPNVVDNGINMIFVKVENLGTYTAGYWPFPGTQYTSVSTDYMKNIMEIMFKIGEWQKKFPNKKIDSVSFASGVDPNAYWKNAVILGAGVIYHTENSTKALPQQ
jgi:hypothetical protein